LADSPIRAIKRYMRKYRKKYNKRNKYESTYYVETSEDWGFLRVKNENTGFIHFYI